MKALIAPMQKRDIEWVASWVNSPEGLEPVFDVVKDCFRVADVKPQSFEVASPLFWVDCPDDCKADLWYYKDGVLAKRPDDAPRPNTPVEVLG